MSKCVRCNVDILDDSMICPLCNGVLDSKKNEDSLTVETLENYESKSIMYPDVSPAMKKMKFFIKLFVFISFIVEAVLILINYITYNGIKWSLICGAALLYMIFTLIYTCQRRAGHKSKLALQFFLAMALVILIDYAIGYTGWSLDYAIPSMIIVFDVLILILMLVNLRNWQSYILLQILVFGFSIIYLIFVFKDIVKYSLLAIIAAAVSGLLLLATVMFGDKKAENELIRRFRV